jgi:hypothetical protein
MKIVILLYDQINKWNNSDSHLDIIQLSKVYACGYDFAPYYYEVTVKVLTFVISSLLLTKSNLIFTSTTYRGEYLNI